MLITPHVCIGVTLGIVFQKPLLIVPLALVSHFLADTVPHWQETMYPYKPTKWTWIRTYFDGMASLNVVFYALSLYPTCIKSILLGALVSIVPDIDTIFFQFPFVKKMYGVQQYWNWHSWIQRETTSWIGVATQLFVVATSLSFIFFFSFGG